MEKKCSEEQEHGMKMKETKHARQNRQKEGHGVRMAESNHCKVKKEKARTRRPREKSKGTAHFQKEGARGTGTEHADLPVHTREFEFEVPWQVAGM